MTPAELLSQFRTKMVDIAQPPLWADDEIYTFMNDAQQQFCRLTGGISDSTSAITQLAVASGDEYVAIDPRILKIRYAKRVSDYQKLVIYNFEDMDQPSDIDDYGMQQSLKLDYSTGPLKGIIVGMERAKIRLLPIPDADDEISMIVYRLPLEVISSDSQPDFEIEDQHHLPLLYWMMKLAYEKPDAETFDRGKSAENETKFLNYCSEAKHERELREHKYRTVAYGGL